MTKRLAMLDYDKFEAHREWVRVIRERRLAAEELEMGVLSERFGVDVLSDEDYERFTETEEYEKLMKKADEILKIMYPDLAKYETFDDWWNSQEDE